MKKWIVRLEAEERAQLEQVVGTGKAAAYKIRHANVLLAVDESDGGRRLQDEEVARTLGISVRSIESLRRRLVEEGLEACLARKKQDRPSVEPIFDGAQEAQLIAVACGPAPTDRVRWTLELLAGRAVELRIVESCSPATIQRMLKKTNSSRGEKRCGVFRRRKTPSSFARWKTCSRCTLGLTIRSGRSFAWMKRASS